jgi:signal peptidase
MSASILVLLLGVAVAVVGMPFAVGGSAMTVLTQSMEPGLPPGTLVVIRPTPVDDIRVGDVITYQISSGEAAVVSHRVISKTYADGELTFVTQGDNNDAPDPEPVKPVQIRGALWYSLPLLGWVNNVLTGSSRPIVLAVVAGGLFLYAAASVAGAVRDRRKRADAATRGDARLSSRRANR